MPIEVTARHESATNELQDYAKSKAEELLEAFPRIEHIHVILNAERHLCLAEAVVQSRNHTRVEAKGSSDNMRASIDMAVEKAEKQLRKIQEKVHDHKVVMKHVDADRMREENT
jgi:putative sigma-54 modulation protein